MEFYKPNVAVQTSDHKLPQGGDPWLGFESESTKWHILDEILFSAFYFRVLFFHRFLCAQASSA